MAVVTRAGTELLERDPRARGARRGRSWPHGAARAGSCSSPATPASARARSCARSARPSPRTCACSPARATACARRGRSGRSPTWPPLEAGASRRRSPRAPARRRSFDALVAELRADGDTAVVIEDVHWADEATFDVLGLLGRRVESLGALVIVTYRTDELSRTHPLRIVLGDLATAAGVRRLRLGPLSEAAVAELAFAGGVDADELYAKTAGNPFFVTEVLACGSGAVPATVRDAVLARAARLSESARRLLDAAAIIPQPTELWLLSAHDRGRARRARRVPRLGHAPRHGHRGRVPPRARAARGRGLDQPVPARRAPPGRARGAPQPAPRGGSTSRGSRTTQTRAAMRRQCSRSPCPPPSAPRRSARTARLREQFARALRYAGSLPALERAHLLERRSFACYLTDEQVASVGALEEALALLPRRRRRRPRGHGALLASRAGAGAPAIRAARRRPRSSPCACWSSSGPARSLPGRRPARPRCS